MDINSLERFVIAQRDMYAIALKEVKSGKKRSHWMWYIFPQLRGLGMSMNAYVYGINGACEAREYLDHPLLSSRLIEITEALLALGESDPISVFGYTDAMKLRSSMTLFASVIDTDLPFKKVLDKFYGGERDAITLNMLKSEQAPEK